MTVGRATDFTAEVEFGTSREEQILRRWVSLSDCAVDARGFLKGGEFDDFDFVVFAQGGLVLCYVEVKYRRTPFAKYGDAMFPLRKHTFAASCWRKHRLRLYGVTEYSCGTLVELDLQAVPAQRKDIARRDRPGMKPVPHVFYSKSQVTVLAGPS